MKESETVYCPDRLIECRDDLTDCDQDALSDFLDVATSSLEA